MEVDEYISYFGISDEELTHFRVEGMKWGERHARRMARADANEFAKARAYYGQGAGTRRKLVKAKVDTRFNNPQYKAEFEHVLSGQNAEINSVQAIGKPNRSVTETGATVTSGETFLHKTGLDKEAYNKIKSAASSKTTYEQVRQFLKDQGIG